MRGEAPRWAAKQRLGVPWSPADLANGAAAGLAAALITSLFQSAWTGLRLPPVTVPAVDPPTEVLAENVYRRLTGKVLIGKSKIVAGEAVHYAMGAALGAAYSLMVKRWPAVAAGDGTAYGLGVWATVEQGGLVVLGLKPLPWKVELAEHVFAASSHLVFGVVLRRCLTLR